MPNTNVEWMLPVYTDDFGNEYKNLVFKYEDNGDNFSNPTDVNGMTYVARVDSICTSGRIFSARKMVIVFTDGTSTELPIPSLEMVKAALENGLSYSKVACISLIGEHWKKVPPIKLGSNQKYFNGGYPGFDKPSKSTVSFKYRLDNDTTEMVQARSIYLEPDDLAAFQTICLEQEDQGSCSFSEAIKLRHFLGIAKNTTTSGKHSRKIWVTSGKEAEIKSCGATQIPYWNCLAYTGTSIADVSLFYKA